MANDDCIGRWSNSVRVSALSDDDFQDPGLFNIFEETGMLKGKHIVGSQENDLFDVKCDLVNKHHILSFRRVDADGFECTYTGKVVSDSAQHFIILCGKFVSHKPDALADDNGDWSAEKPGA